MSHWATQYAAAITEHMAQAILVTDDAFDIIHANPEAARILGATSGTDLHGVSLGKSGKGRSILFTPALRSRGDFAGLTGRYRIKTLGGQELEIDATFADSKTTPGTHLILLKNVDISRVTDQQVYQSEKLAAMDNIVAGVAHELNNPMTAILGYAELLLATEENPKRKQRIALIAEEADRCAKIIGNMLSFTRSFGNAFEMANVSALLEEVVSLRAYQLRVDGVEIRSEIERNVPMTSVQPSAIRRLFLNILHNAHQALLEVPQAQRKFSVSSCLKDGNIAIAISDSGPGIAEDVRYRIFDPFFTTRSLGEGMGLGLSVAYGIVHEHHGKIWMEPRENGGTIMKIELPTGDYTV